MLLMVVWICSAVEAAVAETIKRSACRLRLGDSFVLMSLPLLSFACKAQIAACWINRVFIV
jgi:hypothetical protein